MRQISTVLFLLLAAALVAAPSSDAKEFPRQYIAVKLGGFFPQSGDLDDIHADAGVNGEIALGHYVAPGFAIEGGVGYFETQGDLSGTPGNPSEKFQVVPVTVSLRGQVPYGRFEPYGLVGIGVYFVEDKISGSGSDRHTSLGVHIGLGGNYTLSNQLYLGVEARYMFLKTSTFDVDVRLDGVSFTGNIGYRF